MSDLRYERLPAHDVPRDRWSEIVELNADALTEIYPDTFLNNESVQRAAGMDNIDDYIGRMARPEQPQQLFRGPHLTLALDRNNEVASVVYSANNTSGHSEDLRWQKMEAIIPLHRWAWIGWVAVRPDFQRRGVAREAVQYAIRSYDMLQPVSAHAWPGPKQESTPPLDAALRINGLTPTGEVKHLHEELGAQTEIPTQHYTAKNVAHAWITNIFNRR